MGKLEVLIGDVLGIPTDHVAEDLGFQTVREWDSARHVDLMLALEAALDIEVDADAMVELTTVGAIRRFVMERSPEWEA